MTATHLLSRIAAAAALSIVAASANAALTTYTTSADFAGATTAAQTDTFNDIVIDVLASPTSRPVGSYGYSATAGSGDLFGTGSIADTWLSTQSSGIPITFGDFIGPVQAIGGLFFGSDLNFSFQAGQELTVTVEDSLGATATSVISSATASSFRGFVSTGSIKSLTVSILNTESFATVNDLVLAKVLPAVPEPETYGMLLAGLGMLAFVRRRNKA